MKGTNTKSISDNIIYKPMKSIVMILVVVLLHLSALGQKQNVKGHLSTIDTADLTILKIFPDSFPDVSILFKAETRRGEPVWNLTKEVMKVKENSQDCEVVFLEQISKNKPINLGIVIDHSGSMSEDYSLIYDNNGNLLLPFDENFNLIFPEGYSRPIDNAKKAVKKFIASFNSEKDFISITGFSITVDKPMSLTQDIAKMNSIVDSMTAEASTALYDAMLTGLDEIKESNGVKVLVVLTDGYDNSSKSRWNEVIDEAVKEDIPIYIIGLGDVNKDTLGLISKATKGKFYFTQSSSSLDTVYAAISKQVQAFYNLRYTSQNFSSADSTRQIELSFDINDIYLVTESSSINLPEEVITFIKKKEEQIEYTLYGGIAIIALIASGTLLFYYRKRKKSTPIIKNLFPNPSNGIVNIDFESAKGVLKIININGQIAKSIQINGNEKQFDLSELLDGNYIAVIDSNGQKSNAVNFIIKH